MKVEVWFSVLGEGQQVAAGVESQHWPCSQCNASYHRHCRLQKVVDSGGCFPGASGSRMLGAQ